MIKASALLVALAMGLLVASVIASSLLMVYLSIGVCAVAALLLAAGVLSHWPEIFGRGEPRPASMQESWSAPQVQVGTPALPVTQATGTQATGAGPGDRRPRRENAGGRPSAPPVEVVVPEPEFPAAARGDDLWERVEEELGSGAKRDTGALSWPGTELPVPPGAAGPPGQAGSPGTPSGGASAWIGGHGAGWRPPDSPDDAWPPPAAAFAGSPSRPEPAHPAAASTESADTGRAAGAAGQPAPGAAAAVPSRDTEETAPGSPADEAAEPPPPAATVKADTWDQRPRWIISVGDATPARPVPNSAAPVPAASERTTDPASAQAAPGEPDRGDPANDGHQTAGPATGERGAGVAPDGEPEVKITAVTALASPEAPPQAAGQEPASREPAAGTPTVDGPADREAVAEEPAAGSVAEREAVAEEPAAGSVAEREAAAEEPAAGSVAEREAAAGKPAASGPAGQTAPGRVNVTVVPGVARYHRSECILIRFLGPGDLETMSRQEAGEAKFVPCRACQPDQLES